MHAAAATWPECLPIHGGDGHSGKPALAPPCRWSRHLAGVTAAAVLLHLASVFLLVLLAMPAVREQRRDPPPLIALLLNDDSPPAQPIASAPPQPEATPRQREDGPPLDHPVANAPAPIKEPQAKTPPKAAPPQRPKAQAVSVRPAPAPLPQEKQQSAPTLAAPATSEPAGNVPASRDAVAVGNDAPPAAPPHSPSLLPREEKAPSAPNLASADFSNIREAIVARLVFPPRARKMGISGSLLVSFELLADGHVGEITVNTSSGYQLLDDSVVATIRRLAPFPAPAQPGRLELPIRFNLR